MNLVGLFKNMTPILNVKKAHQNLIQLRQKISLITINYIADIAHLKS